jgi:hypothetical protein
MLPLKSGPVNPVNAPTFVPTFPVKVPEFVTAPVPVNASKEDNDLKSRVSLKYSKIVTVAVAESVFPLASVTIKVTVFSRPIFVQSKVVTSKEELASVQLSKEPLSTSLGIIVAFPYSSNVTVMSWVIAIGSVVSLVF